jgi:hypothetical protein
MTEVEYLLRNGSFFRRTTSEENLGPQSTVLRTLVNENSDLLSPNLLALHLVMEYMIRNPEGFSLIQEEWSLMTHLAMGVNNQTLVTELPYLTVRVQCILNPYTCTIIPYYNTHEPEDRSVNLKLKIPTYDDERLWFITYWDKRPGFTNAYLIITRKGKAWAVPVNNVYGTGNLCFGNFFSIGTRDSLVHKPVECHKEMLKFFLEEPYNSHLGSQNTRSNMTWELRTGEHIRKAIMQTECSGTFINSLPEIMNSGASRNACLRSENPIPLTIHGLNDND